MTVAISPLLLMVMLLVASSLVVRSSPTDVACGQRQLTIMGYITAGYAAVEGDWPWHAGIFRKILGRQDYICGGTVISVNFVVTAAHCTVPDRNVLRGDDLSVRLGLHNRTGPSEHTKTYEVLEIIRHESFNLDNLRNDIALLRMEQDIVYTDYIQPICLWPENEADLNSIINKRGHVVGWGLGDAYKLVELLQEATLGAVDYDTCLKSRPKHFERLLTEDRSSFCAGNANMTNVCSGDSGGGMYYKLDKSSVWYIRGLVSAGSRSDDDKPCDPQQFVTFSDIPYYLNWILRHQEAVKKRNLLNLGNCGLDTHDSTVLENKKPTFLQYPWTAMLEFTVTGSTANLTMCNGALIHPRFVLTVGHCTDDAASKYKLKSVRLGEYNLKTNPDTEKDPKGQQVSTFIQSIDIEKVIRHSSFERPRYDNNIALLKLKNPADIGQPNVKPICLPTLEDFVQNYTTSGWKRVGKQSHIMRRDVAALEDLDSCRAIYGKMKIQLSTEGHHVCGTYHHERDEDCFHFMGGAPLQYLKNADRKNRYFLKGIFAYGFPGCLRNYTDVFVNVNGYTEWIKSTVEGEGFSI